MAGSYLDGDSLLAIKQYVDEVNVIYKHNIVVTGTTSDNTTVKVHYVHFSKSDLPIDTTLLLSNTVFDGYDENLYEAVSYKYGSNDYSVAAVSILEDIGNGDLAITDIGGSQITITISSVYDTVNQK